MQAGSVVSNTTLALSGAAAGTGAAHWMSSPAVSASLSASARMRSSRSSGSWLMCSDGAAIRASWKCKRAKPGAGEACWRWSTPGWRQLVEERVAARLKGAAQPCWRRAAATAAHAQRQMLPAAYLINSRPLRLHFEAASSASSSRFSALEPRPAPWPLPGGQR